MERQPTQPTQGGVIILDFGSQVTQLIARRLREMKVYSEIHPYNSPLDQIRQKKPCAIILSGGPLSVNDPQSPKRDVKELLPLAPLMGICYGMQLMAQQFGGVVKKAQVREYGKKQVHWVKPLGKIPKDQQVWMSHGDVVEKPPEGFQVLARSDENHPAVLSAPQLLAIQFHPEVSHTEYGLELLKHFVFEVAKAQAHWESKEIVTSLLSGIQDQVGPTDHVMVGLSGGVDSTVAARLVTKALGSERVHCFFINNGLLRQGEYGEVLKGYKGLGLNVVGVEAQERFLQALTGVSDPEKKRKTIGEIFIRVFEACMKELHPQPRWLVQGTLYPDVIESVSPRGESVTIKTHHNVGGLPEQMDLKLLEPLRELFKDEVRHLGEELGIPKDSLRRHPFPGPGLAIRVLGPVDKEALETLRRADKIYMDELKAKGFYDQVWQAFGVLLPIRTVGVQGDGRTYSKVLALRAVTSQDAMTADWFDFPKEFMEHISNRITNEVEGVNRVVYDVTSKPPGTIEWE